MRNAAWLKVAIDRARVRVRVRARVKRDVVHDQ